MKIWLDDIREPPLDWVWVKNAKDAWYVICMAYKRGQFEGVSFDHDLGEDGTGYDLACLMECFSVYPSIFINIHSANPVGVENIKKAMENNNYYITVTTYDSNMVKKKRMFRDI